MIKIYTSLSLLIVALLIRPFTALSEQEYSQLNGQEKLVNYQPEQIHIAYGALPTQMIITWTTQSFVNESVVEYGIEKLTESQTGKYNVFKNKDRDFINRQETVHSVLLTNLIPGQRYSKSYILFCFKLFRNFISIF